jgi:SAM-dependent methyltransferase
MKEITTTMQKDKTLRFWDEYHRNESEKEWILPPNEWLLEIIVSQLILIHQRDAPPSSYRVLEIGCGTSSLAYELVEFWNQTATKNRSRQTILEVLATDVSALCIEQQKLQQGQRQKGLGDEYKPQQTLNSHLSYQTLDITQSHEELCGQFDMIVDKGCLDTLLFRSKKAKQWVTRVLHNIRSWLRQTTRDGTEGVYCIITPRRKLLKSIPSLLEGFHIQRIELQNRIFDDGNGGPQCCLEPRSGSYKEESQKLFLYNCRVSDAPTKTQDQTTTVESLPDQNDVCLSCKISFQTFYEREAASHKRSRNEKYWARHWNGHKQHCKGRETMNNNGIE